VEQKEKKIKTWGPNSTPYKKSEKKRKERANFERLNSTDNTIQKNGRSSSYPNLNRMTINRPDTSDPSISTKGSLCKLFLFGYYFNLRSAYKLMIVIIEFAVLTL